MRASLQQPDATLPGRVVSAVVEKTSTGKLLEDWSKVTGKPSVYLQVSKEDDNRLFPSWGDVEGPMFEINEEFGEKAWSSEDDTVLTARDLQLEGEPFVGVEECLRKMSW